MTKKKNENKIPPTCHAYNIEDAIKYGVNSAILLYNINFWLDKNMKTKKNFYNNQVWTFNSVTNFKEIFPELTEKQIIYALKKLEILGVLLVGNFNKKKYDKTKWYSTPEYSITHLQTELNNVIIDKTDVDSTKATDNGVRWN